MIRYSLFWLLLMAGRWLPPWLAYRLAELGGLVAYRAWPRGRKNTQTIMALLLGPEGDPHEAARLARRSLSNFAKYMVDFSRLPRFGPRELERSIVFEGWEHLDLALEEGKGVVLVGFHFGSWDLGGAALAQRYPVHVVVDTFSPPSLDRLIQGRRARAGMHTLPVERAARAILGALRRNEVLGLLIDRPDMEEGVVVNFLDRFIKVPAGVASLALRTGAQVVPGGVVRLSDSKFLGFMDHHLQFQPTGDWKHDVQALTQVIISSLERWVRRYPDQWYVFRSLFWTEEEPSILPSGAPFSS